MGSFSIWHVMIILVFVLIPAVFVVGIVWMTNRSSRAGRGGGGGSGLPSGIGSDVEGRLARLGELLEKGQITQEEYQHQRAVIIAGV